MRGLVNTHGESRMGVQLHPTPLFLLPLPLFPASLSYCLIGEEGDWEGRVGGGEGYSWCRIAILISHVNAALTGDTAALWPVTEGGMVKHTDG